MILLNVQSVPGGFFTDWGMGACFARIAGKSFRSKREKAVLTAIARKTLLYISGKKFPLIARLAFLGLTKRPFSVFIIGFESPWRVKTFCASRRTEVGRTTMSINPVMVGFGREVKKSRYFGLQIISRGFAFSCPRKTPEEKGFLSQSPR